MNADDTRLLRIAFDEARAGFDEGGCPIGSVLARGGEVVAQGRTNCSRRNGCTAKGGPTEIVPRHDAVHLAEPVHDVHRHDHPVWNSARGRR